MSDRSCYYGGDVVVTSTTAVATVSCRCKMQITGDLGYAFPNKVKGAIEWTGCFNMVQRRDV